MKGRKHKDEAIIGRDADAGVDSIGNRSGDKDSFREKLKRGELVIEFEFEDYEDTVH